MNRPDDHFIELIKRSGSADKVIALEAQHELATALEQPLRKGVLVGDVLDGIFERLSMEPGTSVEFPLDLLAPGTENEHVAYTNPGHGRIPERAVEGDYVMVPTYTVASSIDYLLRYAREARWDVVGRAMQVLEAGFVKKMNDDGWHTLLAAGVDRNILVYDGDAADGQFTKRVISLMKTVMRRNAGGNTGSLNRGKMTDLYLSPEALEDIRNWGVDQVDETTRREIYQAGDDASAITRIFGVNLHDMDEMGENQEYQKFFSNQLAASLNGTDPELVVGIDRTANDSFIMPIKQDVQIFEDDALHRHQRAGFYGWAEVGFAVLDNRRILLGSF
jgi:hypothetical protein|tara:strand:+ start:12153 stop:13151 length:999 start_codon:yes stop_codon:yes gene_type:complete